jgi:hypothetical protein
MKDNTLLLVGAGVLAYFLLAKNSSADTGGSIPSFQYDKAPTVITNPTTGTKFNSNVTEPSKINLSPVSVTSPNRFQGVTYDSGHSVGVLDRAMQQSITVNEAQKRANNPFLLATQPKIFNNL